MIAPGFPIARVPTGTPAGICTIENKEILPAKSRCFDWNSENRKSRHRGGHAWKVGGAAGSRDNDFKACRLGALGKIDKPVRRPVCRDDQGREAYPEFIEKGGGMAHRLPIRFAAHNNSDRLFYKGQMETQTFDAAKAAA